MAHTDSTPGAPGANDNASGVGVVTALAGRLRAHTALVRRLAGGHRRRGTPLHGIARPPGRARAARARPRGRRLRWALSLDEVGRGPSYWLRSGARGVRRGVEGELLTAARRAKARVRWVRDDGTGNSDHREFQLAGLPAAKLGVAGRGEPCRHMPCDRAGRLQPRSLKRVRILVERGLRIR